MFFHPLTFSLYVSLGLKWVSCRQHIYGPCLCIHSASLCPLVGAFNPFTFLKNYLFIYLFLAALGLHCGARASHCSGFSCCGARASDTRASVVVACGLSSCGSWALELRLSSCGTRALLFCGMWDLPGPGIKPVSPALAGRFLTTAPPGKSLIHLHSR